MFCLFGEENGLFYLILFMDYEVLTKKSANEKEIQVFVTFGGKIMGSEEQRLKLLCKFNLSALSFLPDFTKTTNKKST